LCNHQFQDVISWEGAYKTAPSGGEYLGARANVLIRPDAICLTNMATPTSTKGSFSLTWVGLTSGDDTKWAQFGYGHFNGNRLPTNCGSGADGNWYDEFVGGGSNYDFGTYAGHTRPTLDADS
jgi:hypothetical protein